MSYLSKLNSLSERKKTLLAMGLFAILIALFYGNTLGNGFVSDDILLIEDNPYITSLSYIPNAFTGVCSNKNTCQNREFSYRPIVYVSLIFTRIISGAPWFFHLIALLEYFIICTLLFVCIRLITKNAYLGLLTALIFLIHPIHSEVVNFVAARPERLHTIFVLAAIIFFFYWRKKRAIRNISLVYFFYTLALLSKEPAVLLPIIFILLDIFVFRMARRKLLTQRYIKMYVVFGAIFFATVLLRHNFWGGGSLSGQFELKERLYAGIVLMAQYIQKLFFPYPLSPGWGFFSDYRFLSVEFFVALSVCIVSVVGIWLFFRRRMYLEGIFAVWIILFLAPALVFIGGRAEQMFVERYLFLPSIGFSFLVAGFFIAVAHRLPYPEHRRRIGTVAILAIFTVVSWGVVFPSNRAWADLLTLYEAVDQAGPMPLATKRDLAELYYLQGDLTNARLQLNDIFENHSDWNDITSAYKAMGDTYRAEGDIDKTFSYYLEAVRTSLMVKRDYVPFNDVGEIYLNNKHDPLFALTYFCQSVNLYADGEVQKNLDKALAQVGEQYIQTNTLITAIRDRFVYAPEKKIQYIDHRCTQESCQFMLSDNPDIPATVIPTLITATDSSGYAVKIDNQAYDPEQRIVILETIGKHENARLTILFPTCSRTYYEVSTP
jgi:protein O-mannosyl-transferase